MDVQGAYRPGLLSALLLDGRDATTFSIERPAHAGDDAASPNSTATMGGCKTLDDTEAKAVSLKKKKKKKRNGDGDEKPPHSSTSVAVDDSRSSATSTPDEGQKEDVTGANAAGSASSLDALSSLFSSRNLEKFKRRARQDQEIDELEVARITDEARERERRLENEEANAGKKRNKKAKKREAEELENRRKLEAERRQEIAQKRAETPFKVSKAVSRDGGKQAMRKAGLGIEKGNDDREEEGEDRGHKDEDSEPESDVVGPGGDSSSDESEEQRDKIDEKVEKEGKDTEKGKEGKGNGDYDNEKEGRTIFVGNLPTTFNPKKVKRLFKEYGAVESVRLRSVAVEGTKVDKAGNQKLVRRVCVNRGLLDKEAKNNVNAYVVYKDTASLEKALEANGIEVEGKHIRVDRARHSDFDHTRSVFLGNLPLDAKEEEVRALFSAKLDGADKAVEGVRLVRDKTTLLGKGFGYVLLADRARAAMALGVHGTKLRGRTMRVMPCGKRTKGRGGQAKPGHEDHKFASFEGRRTTAPEGAQRRLKRKSISGEGGSGGGVRLSGSPGGPPRNQHDHPRTSNTSNGVAGKSAAGALQHKKPRWTNEEGVRAGKAQGGRPVGISSGGRRIPGAGVPGSLKNLRGGRGRAEGPRGNTVKGRGDRGGRGRGRGRGRG